MEAYLAPRGGDGKLNVPMKSPTSTYIVVKKGCSDEIKEAIVKTVNYQYDLDQSQAEGVRPNGMDSPFSWHYYPINVLHCDYDAKEKQIQAVMDCIDGKVAYDDLNGDGRPGTTAIQPFRRTASVRRWKRIYPRQMHGAGLPAHGSYRARLQTSIRYMPQPMRNPRQWNLCGQRWKPRRMSSSFRC